MFRNFRKKIEEANSYESIYHVIGQELWLGEQLLKKEALSEQQQALGLFAEASQYAHRIAEDPHLAARICEGFIWPNLQATNGQARNQTATLLQTCSQAFQQADETNNLIKNYQLALRFSSPGRPADGARLQLANLLTQTGSFEEALRLYREITDTNFVEMAERRIASLNQRRNSPARP